MSSLNSWIQVAPAIDTGNINNLIYTDSTFYAGTSSGTLLMVSSGNWVQVADRYTDKKFTVDLFPYSGSIYACIDNATTDGGSLLKWDGSGAWQSIADYDEGLFNQPYKSLDFSGSMYVVMADGNLSKLQSGVLVSGGPLWNLGYSTWPIGVPYVYDGKIYVASYDNKIVAYDGSSWSTINANTTANVQSFINYSGLLYCTKAGGLFRVTSSGTLTSVAAAFSYPTLGFVGTSVKMIQADNILYGMNFDFSPSYKILTKWTGSAWALVNSGLIMSESTNAGICNIGSNVYAIQSRSLVKYGNKVWASNESGLWTTAENWNPSGIPTHLDNIVFDSNGSGYCTLDASGECLLLLMSGYAGALHIDSAGSIYLFGDLDLISGEINNSGTIILKSSGTVHIGLDSTLDWKNSTLRYDTNGSIQYDKDWDSPFYLSGLYINDNCNVKFSQADHELYPGLYTTFFHIGSNSLFYEDSYPEDSTKTLNIDPRSEADLEIDSTSIIRGVVTNLTVSTPTFTLPALTLEGEIWIMNSVESTINVGGTINSVIVYRGIYLYPLGAQMTFEINDYSVNVVDFSIYPYDYSVTVNFNSSVNSIVDLIINSTYGIPIVNFGNCVINDLEYISAGTDAIIDNGTAVFNQSLTENCHIYMQGNTIPYLNCAPYNGSNAMQIDLHNQDCHISRLKANGAKILLQSGIHFTLDNYVHRDFDGYAGRPTVIESSKSGVYTYLTMPSDIRTGYVSVADVNSSGYTCYANSLTSIDRGHNFNWIFLSGIAGLSVNELYYYYL